MLQLSSNAFKIKKFVRVAAHHPASPEAALMSPRQSEGISPPSPSHL